MTQKEALTVLESGHNVLLTGPAGSGKTFLLNKYISYLKKKKNIGIAITASTGIAATHIGGRTIHSWAGIGIKDYLSSRDLSNLAKKSYLRKQFEKTSVLIIDEISMLHAHRFDLVDQVCRVLKKNPLPFGGLQIIMSGDFFQLPPVSTEKKEAEFVNKAKVWPEMDLQVCYLDEQHRQNDQKMITILQNFRHNTITLETVNWLKSRMNKKVKSRLQPIKLFTHNYDIDVINNTELKKIKSPEHQYLMTEYGEKKLVDSLKKNCLVSEKLILKKGAAVMFVKNKFKEEKVIYVNGSMGIICGFDDNNFPLVRLNSGEEVVAEPNNWTIDDEHEILARITQVPLRLAWAITVHKSQGMTLDMAEIDLSHSFVYGMGYVALSRLKNLAGLFLSGINNMAYQADPRVILFDRELLLLSEEAKHNIKAKIFKKQASLELIDKPNY